jgi:uncharacterized membrane protein
MMKKILSKTFIISFFIIFISLPLAADNDETGKTIEDIMNLIREEQGVSENRAIDPEKVSDDLLAELGDAVMSYRHPDEREHEWMDEMMGGEGSKSLRAMHIAMGYRYLLNGSRYGAPYGGPGYRFREPRFQGPGMMHRGWDRPMRFNGGRMGFDPFSFMPWGGILFWFLVIIAAGLAATGAVIIIKKQKPNPKPLDILKVRLAKGEISPQEYENLKHDIL